MNQQLLGYIKQQTEKGTAPDNIRSALLQAGWQAKDIEEALSIKTILTEKKPRSSGSKLLKIFLILVVGFGISGLLIFNFAPQVYISPFIQIILLPKSKSPKAYSIPIERVISVSSLNKNDYPSINYSDFTFNAPWKTVMKKFDQGQNLALSFEPAEDKKVIMFTQEIDIVSAITNEQSESDITKIKQVLGETTMASNYDLFSAIMSNSPSQITVFGPPKEAVVKSILAVMKSGIIDNPTIDDNIYSFRSANIKGFQIGTPEISEKVYLYLFDNKNGSYKLMVAGNGLTQGEVDFILSSIQTIN